MNRFHCWAINEVLNAYADGYLSVGERKAVECHLERCAICSKKLQNIRQFSADFHAQLSDIKRSEKFWRQFETEIIQKIRENKKPEKMSGWIFFRELREEFIREPVISSLVYAFGILLAFTHF